MNEPKKSKITAAALSVFLRYGYKRVNMSDIAEAAGISRAALYLVFKNKEDVFVGVFTQWTDDILIEVERAMATAATVEQKLALAFEIWVVRPFEMVAASPEARDLMECSFTFAQEPMRQGYQRFENAIVPVLAEFAGMHPGKARMSAEKTAHVLVSAVRGFKQAATNSAELHQLIKELLVLVLA